MRRIAVIAALTVMPAIASLPAANSGVPNDDATRTVTLEGAGDLLGPGAPRDLTVTSDGPENRVMAWLPQDPGTKKWITLDYGPYTIHPGSDLSRLDEEIVGQTGYAVGFEPSVVDVNGDPFPNHRIHIHHAHWLWLDPEEEGYHRWFYGTGEERTQGSLIPRAKADPRFKNGLRYGVQLQQGDRIGFLSMLHNKTAEPMVVYLRVRIQYVYGDHDSVEEAKGWDFHNLTPALMGSTFNVPRTGDDFVFPLDTTKDTIGPHSNYHNPIDESEVIPGVGQVVTMPYSGTVVVGAGHSHPGAKEVVLSNLGRKNDPCPDDGDRFPGVTAARSRNITYKGIHGSEDYQHGVTQDGWRLYLRKGDRVVLNGVYDASGYSFPDAMSYFGMYTDRSEPPKPSQVCKVEVLDRPGASQDQVTRTVRNQPWPKETASICRNCDEPTQKPEPGPDTNLVHIAGFSYLPGNQGVEGPPAGPPVVMKGEELMFINEDYALGGVRHSVTSCNAPCNGPYSANYPLHDGDFHSGALGYTWQETYINAKEEPSWSLDTGKMGPGWYTYYCQLHPWMRGSFYVKR